MAQQKAETYVTLFSNRRVTQAVIDDLSLDTTAQELATRITATVPEDGISISVSADGPSPEEARDIADDVVTAGAAEAKRMEEAGPTREPVDSDGETQAVKSQAQVLIEPNESAILPTSPSSRDPTRIPPVGLLIGYLLAAIRHYNDTKVRHVEEVTGVLGVLRRARTSAPSGGEARRSKAFQQCEALRKLRTNLRFVDVDNQPLDRHHQRQPGRGQVHRRCEPCERPRGVR